MTLRPVQSAAALQDQLADSARRALLLRAIAAALTAKRAEIIESASAESALTPEELAPEFSRMTRTFEMFAGLVEEGSWARSAIDPSAPNPEGAVGPNHDVRSMLVPLRGAVIVFGASNFPLAYGVCGGDTASALAAGCPVVVKEHPAHPKTGRRLAAIARNAIADCGLAPDLLACVEDDGTNTGALARALVEDPSAAAVGFTGSFQVGALLHKIANERPAPIPVFAEMGSVNPNVIFPGALASRASAIANAIGDSIGARYGQQCTCPGIVLAPQGAESFKQALADQIGALPARRMLAPSVRSGFQRAVARVAGTSSVRAVAPAGRAPGALAPGSPLLLESTAGEALASPWILETEMFGPAAIVLTGTHADLRLAIERLPGSLTISVWFDPSDEPVVRDWLPLFTARAGRVVFNGVPTGVRVCNAMVHGGPWPATNRPDSTAVGPRAIERWCRPVCFQNCPDSLLPPQLRNANSRTNPPVR